MKNFGLNNINGMQQVIADVRPIINAFNDGRMGDAFVGDAYTNIKRVQGNLDKNNVIIM